MKGLIAALTISLTLVLASPAGAHPWGGPLYPYGSNPGTSYVTEAEAGYVAINSLMWVEGKRTLRWNAHDRVNDRTIWVGIRSTDGDLHQIFVWWNTSHAGSAPYGWAAWSR